MNFPHFRRAFTLIELLTVIAIIAVLMGLLFPAMNSVKEAARKTQARNDISQLVASVKTYYTEYNRYPVDTKITTDTEYGGPAGKFKNADMMNVLRAIAKAPNTTDTLNPRKVVFFEGNNVKDETSPKAGFDALGEFYDPWGGSYIIAVDANYDNVTLVSTTLTYTDVKYDTSAGGNGIRTGVIAGTLGKDKKKSTTGKLADSDDIVSWQ
ncbi:MAG: hypothetical protein QOD99_537 [Chthoniobacter sp.]|jgi:prepilin-type N-terminal cleavage/methylation domain-containing protein|nr:hypothetical protein [Chthoniobacter sp.]